MPLKLNLRISNKTIYTLIGIFIVSVLVAGVYAYTFPSGFVGHGGDAVWIEAKGVEMYLQDAITNNAFFPSCSDGQIIQYNTVSSSWECADDCTEGQILKYNQTSGAWGCADESGGVISGYEIVTNSATSSGHFTVDVSCPAEKKVLGGGCNQQGGTFRALVDSNPISDSGWHCRGRDVEVSQTITLTAYAICSTADSEGPATCAWIGWSTCTASQTSDQLICPSNGVVEGYQRQGCTGPGCDDSTRCEQVRLYCCN